MSDDVLMSRLRQLECAVRRQRIALVVLGAMAAAAIAMPVSQAQLAASNEVRTRSLVIEDAQGRPRVLLGAPLPALGGQPRSGIRITDPDGSERLGLNLFEDGRIVVGIDAPRGAGDDRNRERINLVADGKGGSSIIFKDRRTSVVGRIYLDAANQLWMEFADYMSTPTVTRRLGLKGDETSR